MKSELNRIICIPQYVSIKPKSKSHKTVFYFFSASDHPKLTNFRQRGQHYPQGDLEGNLYMVVIQREHTESLILACRGRGAVIAVGVLMLSTAHCLRITESRTVSSGRRGRRHKHIWKTSKQNEINTERCTARFASNPG